MKWGNPSLTSSKLQVGLNQVNEGDYCRGVEVRMRRMTFQRASPKLANVGGVVGQD